MVIIWGECDGGNSATHAVEYGVTFPFLCDPQWSFEIQYGQDNYIPSHFIVEPGLHMVVTDDPDARDMIPDYLP